MPTMPVHSRPSYPNAGTYNKSNYKIPEVSSLYLHVLPMYVRRPQGCRGLSLGFLSHCILKVTTPVGVETHIVRPSYR